jgi:hypothetical protein
MTEEYEKRFGKQQHNSANLDRLKLGIGLMPEGGLTNFANCSMYKDVQDVVLAYRLTMLSKWQADSGNAEATNRLHLAPKWTNATRPQW